MSTETAASRSLRWLPGRTAALVLALGGVLTVLNLAKGLIDSDGWWHLAAGRVIAASGVPSTDPFTFTWAGQPWTAHEWLSELIMYRLADLLGIAGLVLIWSLFPAVTFAILVFVLRRAGLSMLAIGPAVVLCALTFTTYVTLRPQPISWLLVAILLSVLLSIRQRHAPWLLLLGPAFALWANLHGLYVVGLGLLVVFTALTVAGRTPLARQRAWVAAGLLAAVIGTVLTPAGLAGLLYPLRYLEAGDWGLGYIPEWNTPNFHEPAHLLLLALMVAMGFAGFRGSPGWLSFVSLISMVGSLLAMRVVPITSVVSMPVLAYAIQDRLERGENGSEPGKEDIGRRALDLGAAVLVVIAAFVFLGPKDLPAFVAAEERRRFPAAEIEVLERAQPDAKVFAEYSWGGYVEYRMHGEGGRSFIDGRNDMFDQRILDDYSLIRAADAGWESRLAAYGATAILLPPDAPITHGPAQQAGWCEAARSDLAVLLVRNCPD
jgi:hypothetical protein